MKVNYREKRVFSGYVYDPAMDYMEPLKKFLGSNASNLSVDGKTYAGWPLNEKVVFYSDGNFNYYDEFLEVNEIIN